MSKVKDKKNFEAAIKGICDIQENSLITINRLHSRNFADQKEVERYIQTDEKNFDQ